MKSKTYMYLVVRLRDGEKERIYRKMEFLLKMVATR